MICLFQDLIGKSDPFLEFCRKTADGSWEVVVRTEVRQLNQYIGLYDN
jgi:hypothetical protein